MTVNTKNLSVLAYSNGFTLWHYKTNDASADVDTEGYFNDVSHIMNIGDIIIANTDQDGTPASGIFTVLSNTDDVVDVADMVSIQGADTD